MARMVVRLNRRNVGSLLKERKLRDDLERRAHRVAAAAGPGHEVQLYRGRNRWRATVRTTEPRATGAGRSQSGAYTQGPMSRLRQAIQAGKGAGV